MLFRDSTWTRCVGNYRHRVDRESHRRSRALARRCLPSRPEVAIHRRGQRVITLPRPFLSPAERAGLARAGPGNLRASRARGAGGCRRIRGVVAIRARAEVQGGGQRAKGEDLEHHTDSNVEPVSGVCAWVISRYVPQRIRRALLLDATARPEKNGRRSERGNGVCLSRSRENRRACSWQC